MTDRVSSESIVHEQEKPLQKEKLRIWSPQWLGLEYLLCLFLVGNWVGGGGRQEVLLLPLTLLFLYLPFTLGVTARKQRKIEKMFLKPPTVLGRAGGADLWLKQRGVWVRAQRPVSARARVKPGQPHVSV